MDWGDVAKLVGAFGGIVTISAGISAYVGNLISSRVIESHKANLGLQLETHKSELSRTAERQRLLLKRQELMFEREYSAAADFYRLFLGVIPEPSAINMDWSDAQARIASDFHKHASDLKLFLMQHSASISETVREKLQRAREVAHDGIFEVGSDTHGEDYGFNISPNDQVRQLVDQFYRLLQEADKQIKTDLESGSFSLREDQRML